MNESPTCGEMTLKNPYCRRCRRNPNAKLPIPGLHQIRLQLEAEDDYMVCRREQANLAVIQQLYPMES
jgi:hypothetical protein